MKTIYHSATWTNKEAKDPVKTHCGLNMQWHLQSEGETHIFDYSRIFLTKDITKMNHPNVQRCERCLESEELAMEALKVL